MTRWTARDALWIGIMIGWAAGGGLVLILWNVS